MMKLLFFKPMSDVLLLFVFLSVLWNTSDSQIATVTKQSPNITTQLLPENVKNVYVVTQNETSITLMWENVSSYILAYDDKNIEVSANQESGSVHQVVSPLNSGTNYSFTLITVFGELNSTGFSFFAVTAPENVKSVSVLARNETSITLKWDKVENISTYILEYDGTVMEVNATQEDETVQHVVSSLTAGTEYSFTLFTVFGEVNSSGYSFPAVTAPENVKEVEWEALNENSISLKWDKVKNISAYILEYDGTVINVNAAQEDETVQHVVSSLTAGTEYSFTLFAVFGGVNSSGYSFSAVTAPENVKSVSVLARNETSITLKWDKVRTILTYILEYDGTVMEVNATQEDEAVQHVVSSLTAGTEYSFTLFTVFGGVNSSGYSFSAVTAPENVKSVSVLAQNETSITLKWDKVENISTYILEYDGTVMEVNATQEDEAVQHVVSSLTAGTEYSFTLFTVFGEVNSSGYSFSAVTAPENVKSVSVLAQNETSITLKWDKVENISTYILEYDGTVMEVNATQEDEAVQHVVSSLTAGTEYSFTVFTVFRGVNSSGYSFSAVTAPENVKEVEWEALNETSVTLEWNKVKNILTYILEYNGRVMDVNATQENEAVRRVVSSLTAGTKYNFNLFTVFGGVNSTGHSFSAVTVPTMVSSVSVTERFATRIVLVWESVNAGWEYKLEINASDASINPTRSSNTVSYKVLNLSPGTLYAFSVITQFSGVNSSAFNSTTVTSIDCAAVSWHVTNSSIQGTIEGLFSNATATYESNVHVSPGGANVSFTGLYPGATYKISLKYEMSSTSLLQCEHMLTLFPPLLSAHCDFWASGYSARIVWNKPNGVWTNVEVNVTGTMHTVDGKEDHLIINGLQPAKKYKVSLASVSGTERKSEPFVFFCLTDQRGVIAGSFFAVLLFGILICVAVFIFLKRPDIIRRKKSFIGGSKLPSAKEKVISVAKFPDHFNQLSLDENRGFSQEYEDLASVGTEQTHKVATLPDNRVKNRFTNVLPYDWCRVKLNTSSPSEILDYINASYMPGYNSKREYIATQGPLPSTVNDFWRMIWEQRVNGIVMVTNCAEAGRTKCEQYWPGDRNPCSYGELLVTVRSEKQEPSWTLREFEVKNKNTSEERTVMHFHFIAWPDHGVPQDTQVLIQFRGLVRQHIQRERTKTPTVVHCSAGVGRTGTIIALDVLLQQLEKEQAVGINAFVHKMRLNRPHMVQTESQYVFLHQCIMDSLQPSMKTDEHIYENTDMIYANATALQELR